MKTVLVAYASRMGSTQEIATAIGDQLTGRGFNVHVVAAAAAPNARTFDAVVLGSALYTGRWDRDALGYLRRNGPDLADRPTWLFQSGPTGPSAKLRGAYAPRRPASVRQDRSRRPDDLRGEPRPLPRQGPARALGLGRRPRRRLPRLGPDPGLGR